ncbi:GroES-like protein [Xylariomycetidae sp. FL2044]|nr:GroES-like protein [Xylariomycetidae sp. FL2044]
MAVHDHTPPEIMDAVQIVEFKEPYQLNRVPVPRPGPRELLVKVAAASYCHTDNFVAMGILGVERPLPRTASHEGSGTVAAVGDGVTAFRPGDRVMCGLSMHPCGTCDDCVGPDESLRPYCANIDGQVGIQLDGCFAEYVLVDERTTAPLPDEIDFASAAPLACAGRTIWKAVLQADLQPGQWLAILGSGGGLGHIGIQFAKAMGLRVVGIDVGGGVEFSREMGADVAIDAQIGNAQVIEQVRSATGKKGVASTIILTDAPGSAILAAAITRTHGTVIQIAIALTAEMPVEDIIRRDIRVRGGLIASPDESRAMLRFMVQHGIKVKMEKFDGLSETNNLVEAVHDGKVQGKGVVVVDPSQQ